MMEYDGARNRMVEAQLISHGISDRRVLDVFRRVPRHEFVPQNLRDVSYADGPLPIGEAQTISQPYMVALMTQLLELEGDEKILEIGAGSGYQTAILASLAKEVYSVERIAPLAKSAESVLKRLGYNNVKIRVADGTLGWAGHAPYDGIIVTAGAPKIPDAYIEELASGGRLVIPVGNRFSQILTIAQKKPDGSTVSSGLSGCVFVPLIGKDGWKE